MTEIPQPLSALSRNQRTLKKEAFYSGIGIHTGQEVTMRFCPAPQGTGIVFKRVDLPDQPLIPAHVKYVCDTARSTTIGIGTTKIHTIEHVMAALRASHIDNLWIELSNVEPPVGNGSSDVFVKMIEEAGIEIQNSNTSILRLQRPVYWSEGDIHIVGLPYEGYKISYTLSYPESKTILKSQFHTLVLTPNSFKNEISTCRTFAQYHEISYLMDKGLIKGGSLENAVIIKDDAILSKNGLFFPDEMVRHKILDLIGDLSLVGTEFYAHIIAIRSGHRSNYEFAKQLLNFLPTQE